LNIRSKVEGWTSLVEDFAMVCQSDLGIHEALSRYLSGACTLQEFEDWFMPVLWDLADRGNSDLRDLAGTIANLIAEYSNETLAETSLRKELAVAVSHFAKAGSRDYP
jgi:hypothetical protein